MARGWSKTKDWDAIQSGRKKPARKRYTDAQRARYWKKKYFDLLNKMRGWA